MKSFQIEAWARTVIDRVVSGKPNEDARVELKASWPESLEKTARQLAGHANAARGEPIMWLVGIDQKDGTINDVSHLEIASWYDQVQSQFDEFIAPTLKDLNISYEGKTLVALVFDTERFPFVVKVSDGRLEIPWREGTRTRSARRSDLFKLLIPIQSLPRVEVLSGDVTLNRNNQGEHDWKFLLYFYLELQGGALVIPFHRCEAKLEIPKLGYSILLDELRLAPPYTGFPTNSRSDSVTMTSTSSELLVEGPGRARCSASKIISDLPTDLEADVQISLRLLPVGAEYPVMVSVRLSQSPTSPKDSYTVHTWTYKPGNQ